MGRPRIFLCYRREDTRWVAGRLHGEFRHRYEVFQDVTAIRPGIRYPDQIREEIGRCDVLIVVMGENWLSAADSKGRRRLDSPRDLVRLEIATALQRGIPIIPVLVQRASMPADVDLPDDIADLSFYHACEVTDTRWDYDVGVLVKAIDDLVGSSVPDETPPGGSQGGRGGKGEHYRAFWTRFLERVQAEHPSWTTARIPQKDNWITMPSGIKGAVYGYNFAAGGRLRSELYIDGGDAEANLALFRALRTRAAAIEAVYGKELSWEDLPTRRACRIADYTSGDVTNTDQHDAYVDWFFDTGIRFRRALPGPADLGVDGGPNLAAVPRVIQVLRHGRSDVTGVAFSPDGRLLATGSNDKKARLWEVATGQKRISVHHGDRVWGVAYSPDGRFVATVGHDRTARLWEVANGQQRATVTHTNAILGVAFSPDGRLLATGSIDRTARLWEVPGGQRRARLTHGDSVWGVAFSPDGRLLATAGEDGTARLWEVPGGQEHARVTHDHMVWGVAFSLDGRFLATAGGDGTARLWDVAGGQEHARVTHGDYAVRGVAFSPDGRFLATAGSDGTARLWEVASGQERARVTHNDQVVATAFSPDGQLLATGSHDDTARIWELYARQ